MKTLIIMGLAALTFTTGLWTTFDIMLVDESEFSTSYLQATGRPGH